MSTVYTYTEKLSFLWKKTAHHRVDVDVVKRLFILIINMQFFIFAWVLVLFINFYENVSVGLMTSRIKKMLMSYGVCYLYTILKIYAYRYQPTICTNASMVRFSWINNYGSPPLNVINTTIPLSINNHNPHFVVNCKTTTTTRGLMDFGCMVTARSGGELSSLFLTV